MVNEGNNSEVFGTGLDAMYVDIMAGNEEPRVYLISDNDEPMTFKGITFCTCDEADDVHDEYLRLQQQMEFSAECTVSPKFIREFQMATGVYWRGKVPRVIMKRWWR